MNDALHCLAAEIAASDGAQEPFLFEAAAAALLHEPDRRLRRWIDARAYAQATMHLSRLALPQRGFQFGYLPPGAAGCRGLASTWRRGDPSALPFTAATPALALLRATIAAVAREAETNAQSACETCRGLGWFVTADNRKQICGHG